jgi:hypothetical protein
MWNLNEQEKIKQCCQDQAVSALVYCIHAKGEKRGNILRLVLRNAVISHHSWSPSMPSFREGSEVLAEGAIH